MMSIHFHNQSYLLLQSSLDLHLHVLTENTVTVLVKIWHANDMARLVGMKDVLNTVTVAHFRTQDKVGQR